MNTGDQATPRGHERRQASPEMKSRLKEGMSADDARMCPSPEPLFTKERAELEDQDGRQSPATPQDFPGDSRNAAGNMPPHVAVLGGLANAWKSGSDLVGNYVVEPTMSVVNGVGRVASNTPEFKDVPKVLPGTLENDVSRVEPSLPKSNASGSPESEVGREATIEDDARLAVDADNDTARHTPLQDSPPLAATNECTGGKATSTSEILTRPHRTRRSRRNSSFEKEISLVTPKVKRVRSRSAKKEPAIKVEQVGVTPSASLATAAVSNGASIVGAAIVGAAAAVKKAELKTEKKIASLREAVEFDSSEKASRRNFSKQEMSSMQRANLDKLAAELNSDDSSAGSLSFFGISLLCSVLMKRRSKQCLWTAASITLSILEMVALHSIAFSMSFQKCVYDDDCLVGRVCVHVPKPDFSTTGEFYEQSICADCADVIVADAKHLAHKRSLEETPGWVPFIEAMTGVNTHYVSTRLTSSRTGDRWPVADTATEFCLNYLEAPFVQAWSVAARAYHDDPSQGGDFSKCLHVQEAMERRGEADFIVTVVAFLLVCLSISSDRKQQLLNQHLRHMLLPPPWKSLRSAAFKVLELILASLLPTVCLSMILLLFGAASLTATDVLLNGVAVAFVLLVDDELPEAVLSATDRQAIDEFANGIGDVDLMVNINRKGNAHALVSFVCLFIMCKRASSFEPMYAFHLPPPSALLIILMNEVPCCR